MGRTNAAIGVSLMVFALWSSHSVAAPKTDTVVLINGNAITGEVKRLDRGILSYSTDFMGTLNIEWDKVAQLRSSQLMEIEFVDGTRVVGRPVEFGESGAMRVEIDRGGGTVRNVSLDTAMRIATLEVGRLRDRLDGHLSLGWSAASSNDVSQVSLSAGLTYRDELRFWDFAYAGSRDRAESNPASDSHNLGIEQQRFLGDRWFWTGGGNVASNDELGLDLRVLLGGGAGRYFFQSSHQVFFAAAGLGISHEEFSDGQTQESLEGILRFSYDVFRFDTPEIDIATLLTAYPSLTVSGRVRTDTSIEMRFEIIDDLFYRLSLLHHYDNKPQSINAVTSDWSLVTSLGYSF